MKIPYFVATLLLWRLAMNGILLLGLETLIYANFFIKARLLEGQNDRFMYATLERNSFEIKE